MMPKFLTTFLAFTWSFFGIEAQNTLTFLHEPQDTFSFRGTTIQFDCSIFLANQSSKIEYKWRRNDSIISFTSFNTDSSSRTNNDRFSLMPNGTLLIKNVTDSAVSIDRNQKFRSQQSDGDAGFYQCQAIVDQKWTFLSRKARLVLTTLNRFDEEPEDRTVLEGETVQFSCLHSFASKFHPKISWLKDNVPLNTADDKRFHILPVSGSLHIKQTKMIDQGMYKCKVDLSANLNTVESREARLKVVKNDVVLDASEPKFVVSPKNKLVNLNESFILECATNGQPEPQIKWWKDRKVLELDTRMETRGQGSLVVNRVNVNDSGIYTCRASNSEDTLDASATVTVSVPPYFTTKPQNVYAKETQDVDFSCLVDGKPLPIVTWLKNGEVIVPSDYFTIDQAKLKIYGLVQLDQGAYQCLAENEAGSAQASAVLSVEPIALSGLTKPDNALPSEPMDLKSLKIGGRSISISWQPPASNSHSAIGYSVHYKKDGSERERQVNVSLFSNKDYALENLQPNTQYTVQVAAIAKNGMGPLSAALRVTTLNHNGLPQMVRNLHVNVQSPTNVLIRWDPPVEGADSIAYYRLFYSPVQKQTRDSTDSNEQFLPMRNKDQMGDFDSDHHGLDNDEDDYNDVGENEIQVPNALSYDLPGLKTDTEYQFRIEAVNSHGSGPPSQVVAAKTYSDVPSAPPRNVTVVALTADSVVLRWLSPAEKDRNGAILSYKIRYKHKVRGAQIKHANATALETQKLIAGLQSGQTYSFAISALTINGSGPYSEWLNFLLNFSDKDDYQVLGPVTSLKLEGRGSEIHLSWAPPQSDGTVRGYKISWGPGIPDVHHELVPAGERYHVIKNLRPNREYVVCIRAYNKVEGFPVYETVRTVAANVNQQKPSAATGGGSGRTLHPPVEVRAVTRSSTSIQITWLDQDFIGNINGQRDNSRYYNVSISDPHKHNRLDYHRARKASFTFEQLRPNTRYEFAVQVFVDGQRSEWSMTAFNQTFSAPPTSSPTDLTVVQLKDNPHSVILNWMPPKHANGVISSYILYYTIGTDASTIPDSNWRMVGFRGDRLTTTIDEILPDTDYLFRIQAKNDKGHGPKSAPRAFKTIPIVPGLAANRHRGGSKPDLLASMPTSHNKDDTLGGLFSSNYGPSSRGNQNGSVVTPVPMWAIILIVVASVLFVAVVFLAIFMFVSRKPQQNRRLNAAAKMSGAKDLKPPPDLWIDHDQHGGGRKRHPSNGGPLDSNGGTMMMMMGQDGSPSMAELRRAEAMQSGRRAASPAESDSQPRYHSLAMMSPPAVGTLPKNYRHNVAGGIMNNLDMPLSARCYPSMNSTPHVVYTGPKSSLLNRDGSISPLTGSGALIVTSTGLTVASTSTPPSTTSRAGNPLKSFTVLTNPPPAPPLQQGGQQGSTAKIHSARANGAPICMDNRSPAPKLGVLANGSKHRVQKPLLSNPLPDGSDSASPYKSGNIYGSVKEVDNEEMCPLERSCSTEELSVQMRNLDNLMKDLNEISANEFDA